MQIIFLKRVIIKRKVKFETVANDWLESKNKYVKISTYLNYKYTIEKYFFPYLKNYNLKKIENYNYENLIKKLNLTLGTKSLNDCIVKLKSILEYTNEKYGT